MSPGRGWERLERLLHYTGSVLYQHHDATPTLHPTAYVADTAVLRGDVRVGSHTAILDGAVVTAAGGQVTIGSESVVMENAVLRGAPGNPLQIGDTVLIGPQAHVSGCTLEDECFVATGVAIFNGAHLGRRVEVRIGGVVHVNTVLEEGSMVPIGWVAVGDPAEILPPERHEEIWRVQRTLDFPGTVWGKERGTPRAELTRRYARSLTRHRDDDLVGEPGRRDPAD